MKVENTCSVVCEYLGPHRAVILYQGAICLDGAMAVERQLGSLFGYYKYTDICLRLESPGGSIDAMQFILRKMRDYEARGMEVAVCSTFLCASAAAFILAMGQWGTRYVDRSSNLLFHSARVATGGHGMTAEVSTNLSQTLLNLDLRIVEVVVERIIAKAGGEVEFARLVLQRCAVVERDWDALSLELSGLYAGRASKQRPDWLRGLKKSAQSALAKGSFASEISKILYRRMQLDVRMDLREAYCTCLIDGIEGVLDAKAATVPCSIQENRFDGTERCNA